MLEHIRDIQQHPHGNEEKAGKNLAGRNEIVHRLVTELTSRDNQACQKGPKRQRYSRKRQGPRRSEAHQKDGQNEEIAVPRLSYECE